MTDNNNNTNAVKAADPVVAKVVNLSSEKIVNTSNSTSMKLRVCPKQQNPSASSSNGRMLRDRQAQFLVMNHANFRKSGEPARVMYYDSTGSWADYPPEVLDLTKCSFRDGKPALEVSMQGCNCLLDFYRMLEVQFDTGLEKSIAWIDVSGKCFFPPIFVNSNEELPGSEGNGKLEPVVGADDPQRLAIEVKIVDDLDNQENLNKRKRETGEIEVDQVVKADKPQGSSSNVRSPTPKRHQLDAVNGSEMGLARWPNTRWLREEDKEYGIMKSLFLSGLGRVEPPATITCIHQCTRIVPLEKERYEAFADHMETVKKARGDSNTVFAWLGTSANGVDRILSHGLGLPDEVQRPGPFGFGVYLSSVKSSVSSAMLSVADDNGEKHIILCRVILGKCEKVKGAIQMLPSSSDFDTGVDDLTNPRWYVVWHTNMNTNILPELVVSFKGADNMQGITVPDLISKLGRSLPPKVQELQTLLGSWKDGKMGKDMLMQQLRSVVGEEMLHSVFNEIHG